MAPCEYCGHTATVVVSFPLILNWACYDIYVNLDGLTSMAVYTDCVRDHRCCVGRQGVLYYFLFVAVFIYYVINSMLVYIPIRSQCL